MKGRGWGIGDGELAYTFRSAGWRAWELKPRSRLRVMSSFMLLHASSPRHEYKSEIS